MAGAIRPKSIQTKFCAPVPEVDMCETASLVSLIGLGGNKSANLTYSINSSSLELVSVSVSI